MVSTPNQLILGPGSRISAESQNIPKKARDLNFGGVPLRFTAGGRNNFVSGESAIDFFSFTILKSDGPEEIQFK